MFHLLLYLIGASFFSFFFFSRLRLRLYKKVARIFSFIENPFLLEEGLMKLSLFMFVCFYLFIFSYFPFHVKEKKSEKVYNLYGNLHLHETSIHRAKQKMPFHFLRNLLPQSGKRILKVTFMRWG